MKLDKPFKTPDFEDLRRVLLREPDQKVVPMIELWIDIGIMSAVTGMKLPYSSDELVGLLNLDKSSTEDAIQFGIRYAQLATAFSAAAGYDYVISTVSVPILRPRRHLKENPSQGGKIRVWREEHAGLIACRQDLKSYSWPSLDQINMAPVEFMATLLPANMKLIVFYPGIFEDLTTLMGFENMAIKSIEEPELLEEILERLTRLAEAAIDRATAHPAVGAVFYGEDMGFRTGTMLTPAFMREYVLPRHKRIVAASHKHGKPFILHSCGRISALMDDLIDVVKIDALHSFQDIIEPVEQVYAKYSSRIAILGGLDMDLLARGTEDQIRRRTRQILDACAPGGNFALGAGNSITDFVPIDNYYAMLNELKRWNEGDR
jgi:uroporphyrinogen decarboxylase